MNEPVAIVGMALRAPQASNLDEYWALLRDGADVVREVPAWRWDALGLEQMLEGVPSAPGVRYGSFIEAVDEFDPPRPWSGPASRRPRSRARRPASTSGSATTTTTG
jgi:acyl transferase domain-containing protein